jgi:Fe-S-cluster-containing dehydrogenase component/CRP-like cAMP-binding protein
MAAEPTKPDQPLTRRDDAFDPDMAAEELNDLLGAKPFSEMDKSKFKPSKPLSEILRLHARIVNFDKGDIIVRQGEYGTSAFLIMGGAVRVVQSPNLPEEQLGRKAPEKKGVFRTLAQLWNGWRPMEVMRRPKGADGRPVGQNTRQDGGEVHVFLQDLPLVMERHKTAQMKEGALFGEIGALSRMPRVASIFADVGGAKVAEIRWQGFRDLIKADNTLRAYIDGRYRANVLRDAIDNIPLFKHLSSEQRQAVTQAVEFATYGEYDWSGKYKDLVKAGTVLPEKEPVILSQDDYPNGLVIVRAGFARVTRKFGNGERTLKYIGAGQLFGLEEIAHNWRNKDSPVDFQYSLRAIGYTHLLIVPTRTMNEVVLPSIPKEQLPPLVVPIKETLVDPAAAGANRPRVSAEVLEFLTAGRYFNGTATMVIDLERCTRCDDCVRACASTHDNNPRFLRHGPSNGRLMIANACMHCADPVCMIGCPTGAIHRESTGQVVINPATCIGCETCYGNCPYEAIRMVEVRDENGELFVEEEEKPAVNDHKPVTEEKNRAVEMKNPVIKMKATKCDLCFENHGGPACQRACPHGALERINLNDLNSLARWLKR